MYFALIILFWHTTNIMNMSMVYVNFDAKYISLRTIWHLGKFNLFESPWNKDILIPIEGTVPRKSVWDYDLGW
jgi:hypothetical protein